MKKYLSFAFVIFAFLFLAGAILYRFILFPIHDCSFQTEEIRREWTREALKDAGLLKVCPELILPHVPVVNLPASRSLNYRSGAMLLPWQVTVEPTQISPSLSVKAKINNQ